MRVALSMLTLVPGVSGGSETYARELARALARVGMNDVEAMVPTLAPDAGGGLPTFVADGYPASTRTLGRLRAMSGVQVRPGGLGAWLNAHDVAHYPLTVPIPPTTAPTVVTLLDVQHLDLPQLFSRSERLFRAWAYDRASRRADQVIVISEWVRERVIDRLGLDPERVHAIHLAVDHHRFTPTPDTIREQFLYYPARPWPHKNHARLFEAFGLLRSTHPGLTLVLSGTGHDEAGLPDGVEATGNLPLVDRIALYRRAALTVFPSLYEGFGLPPIEAMACGCPVAASDVGSIPEVCGAAAVLFDPTDPEAIAAGIREALARADELAALGLERAAAFTWDATARAHDVVYALAAG